MSEQTVAQCPGCHFGCNLDAYQCGRGKEFYELAASGQPVPERRWPMFTPSEKAEGRTGKPPLNERVMRGLNMVSFALRRRHEEAGEKKIVAALVRGGKFMSLPILSKRTHIPREELSTLIEDASTAPFVTIDIEEIAPLGQREDGDANPRKIKVARLTEEGAAQARVWDEEREVATEEFLAPLSNEEREQLDSLLLKLMKHQAPPEHHGKKHS